MARKHARASPHRNVVPMESHSDGQDVGYFPRTLWTVLLALGSSKPPRFIRTRGCCVETHTFGVYEW
jgi:hypothetical protein